MKIVYKKDCEFVDGFIIKDDEVIPVPKNVACQLNRLDYLNQISQYYAQQPKAVKAPTLEGFHRVTARDSSRHWEYADPAETPTIDEQVATTMAMLDEYEEQEKRKALNNVFRTYQDLLDWLDGERWIVPDDSELMQIDCISLGNPLELEPFDIQKVIDFIINFRDMECHD